MCNFWPRLQILGGSADLPSPDPAFPSPCIGADNQTLTVTGWAQGLLMASARGGRKIGRSPIANEYIQVEDDNTRRTELAGSKTTQQMRDAD